MTSAAWQQARRILCVRLDYLGDVLMTTPAMRALRESSPGSRITLLTSSGGGAVAPFIPEIDDVIAYDAPWLKNGAPHPPAEDRKMIDLLAEGNFDAAVIFTVYSQNPLPSAMLCHLAGIPLRLAHSRENPYRLLTDWVTETEPEQQVRHEVRRQLDLVATVGAKTADERLSFRVLPEHRERMQRVLRELAAPTDRPWIMLHPGATAASRRYPAASFVRAARMLVERSNCLVLITGGAGERELAASIASQVPGALSVADRFGLGELAALIEACSLVICNNTGPAHLAAALGTPVVDLYALTNPQHTPWQVPAKVLFHDVDCRFCYKSVCPQGHHACLQRVDPYSVADAGMALLRGEGVSSGMPLINALQDIAAGARS
ncbi:lipopolysaccharide heptosyltransferase II [Noviherbaspirillum galbum]|uniref:lipopolysaccharide heptosyltransferase II n=1 Tax=Noviherbaspirillum galbum TaxID=2709383 RepID=A0A6B3SPN8_9BURK|nr:lipopolysaccharide heptosyltransferase II [Noviherbaspirillum galbum]NEX60372.1 lipopolysaccharide heptosyltransferase II [Noviherbaspirillum galbum]